MERLNKTAKDLAAHMRRQRRCPQWPCAETPVSEDAAGAKRDTWLAGLSTGRIARPILLAGLHTH